MFNWKQPAMLQEQGYRSSCEALHKELCWMPLTERRQIHKLSKIYAIHNNQAPSRLCETLNSYQICHIYITPIGPTIQTT